MYQYLLLHLLLYLLLPLLLSLHLLLHLLLAVELVSEDVKLVEVEQVMAAEAVDKDVLQDRLVATSPPAGLVTAFAVPARNGSWSPRLLMPLSSRLKLLKADEVAANGRRPPGQLRLMSRLLSEGRRRVNEVFAAG